MSEQVTGGAPVGGNPAANGGGLPLPATRENFMENMRAKDAQNRERAQQARALGQRTQQQPTGNGISERAREAERQAKSTSAEPNPQSSPQDDAAGGVSRETASEGSPETQTDPNQPQEGAETGPLDGDELFAKAKEWRDSPTLPDEFKDRLIEQKILGLDGRKTVQMVTVAELQENGMRQYDYSRSLDVLRGRDADIGKREQRMQQHFEGINDPKAFIERHEDLGYSEVLDAALLEYAGRKQRERRVVQAAGLAAMNQYGCDVNDKRVHNAMEEAETELKQAKQAKLENRRSTREREAYDAQRKQQEQQQRSKASSDQLKRSLDQLRPVAFKAYGVADNGANEVDFYRHLKWVTDNDRDWDGEVVSIQHCMRASESLAQELGDRRGHNPTPQAKPKPLGGGPRLGGSGVARQAARAEQNERKRPSDFASQYLKRGF